MIVKGKPMAKRIREELATTIREHELDPHLVILRAGSNQSSEVYISLKAKVATKLGITATIARFQEQELETFRSYVESANTNPDIHGMIIQLPVYQSWPAEELIQQVTPEKDVDGFLPESPYTEATALAIWEMIAEFSRIEGFPSPEAFLAGKKIVVLGKGRTAGQPTLTLLKKKGFEPVCVSSTTQDPDNIIRSGDLVISAVGKEHIVNGSNIKEGCYVIGVGVDAKEVDGETQLFGDIHEEEIAQKAKLYCPTLNGIGPLTITFLLKNVVEAALRQKAPKQV
jgi:methylenetetrahydrofolate dehydrogenase (NADP+)/methenyltetrahydrofolate cyclohydrolase